MIGGEQYEKRNARGKGCGKDAPWKTPKADFSTSLGNPAKKRGIPTFHTASTAAGYSFVSGLTGSDPHRRNWLPLSPALTAGAEHVIIYHLLTEGHASARVEDGDRIGLDAGDVVIFPHGRRAHY